MKPSAGTEEDREAARLFMGFLRLLRSWTQEELAKACGLGRRTIGRYESGDITPSGGDLRRFAAAAGLSPLLVAPLLAIFRRVATRPGAGGEGGPCSTSDELAAEIASEIAAKIAGVIEPEIQAALAELPFEAGDPVEIDNPT